FSPYHARLAATPLRSSFSGSRARPAASIIDGPGQRGGDCGSTSPLDELAQFLTHTAHYSPVMIAPLSIKSSHADCALFSEQPANRTNRQRDQSALRRTQRRQPVHAQDAPRAARRLRGSRSGGQREGLQV